MASAGRSSQMAKGQRGRKSRCVGYLGGTNSIPPRPAGEETSQGAHGMATQAANNVKFGFWVAAGFGLFAVVLTIIMALSMWALGKS